MHGAPLYSSCFSFVQLNLHIFACALITFLSTSLHTLSSNFLLRLFLFHLAFMCHHSSFLPSLAAALHPALASPHIIAINTSTGEMSFVTTAAAAVSGSGGSGVSYTRSLVDPSSGGAGIAAAVVAANTRALADANATWAPTYLYTASASTSSSTVGSGSGVSGSLLYSFAGQVVACLPPSVRVATYGSSNYDRVRAGVADFASSMLYVAGFSEVRVFVMNCARCGRPLGA